VLDSSFKDVLSWTFCLDVSITWFCLQVKSTFGEGSGCMFHIEIEEIFHRSNGGSIRPLVKFANPVG
jgi:hypothetical protein